MGFITLKISAAALAVIAGIGILLFPKLLRLFVGLYLIAWGVLGLLDSTLA